MRVAPPKNQRRYKPSCQGVRDAQGHQLVPSRPVGNTDMVGADSAGSLSWRSSQTMSRSWFQTLFPFPSNFILGTDKASSSSTCSGQ